MGGVPEEFAPPRRSSIHFLGGVNHFSTLQYQYWFGEIPCFDDRVLYGSMISIKNLTTWKFNLGTYKDEGISQSQRRICL
jgi:hypothetical protein